MSLILKVVCSSVCGFVGRLVRVLAVVGVGVCVFLSGCVCVCVRVWHVSCFHNLCLSSFSFIFVFFLCHDFSIFCFN